MEQVVHVTVEVAQLLHDERVVELIIQKIVKACLFACSLLLACEVTVRLTVHVPLSRPARCST